GLRVGRGGPDRRDDHPVGAGAGDDGAPGPLELVSPRLAWLAPEGRLRPSRGLAHVRSRQHAPPRLAFLPQGPLQAGRDARGVLILTNFGATGAPCRRSMNGVARAALRFAETRHAHGQISLAGIVHET